jgi:hypothetical protein
VGDVGLDDGGVAITALGALLARDGVWCYRGILVPACGALSTISCLGVVIKAVVAVVYERGSTVAIRGIRLGSGLNQEDSGSNSKHSSTLGVGCPPPGIGAEI